MGGAVLVVLSGPDPVASRVSERWGALPATGTIVDGVPVRRLAEGVYSLRRPGAHIHDDRLDLSLPPDLVRGGLTLVFPSIHQSEQNVPCLTVHPIGNPGPRAEVGGRPRVLVPTDPLRMSWALRALSARAAEEGLSATYEATHHGPELALPAFFVEIGFGLLPEPPAAAVRILAEEIPRISAEGGEKVALAVGGGHYAPHFTDLALRRRWSFGHIVSRHALAELDPPTARAAYEQTVGAEGIVFARAEDANHPALRELGPRLRDGEAPGRAKGSDGGPTPDARAASGT
ncbi:MAG TPA: D-aminoacyl-tRNA deacylase [Thermoplasmata archaeon]|nr:D-aminoacyl-tRNA deacylase [Thermoplasmata archaeon]